MEKETLTLWKKLTKDLSGFYEFGHTILLYICHLHFTISVSLCLYNETIVDFISKK
jgi:hypothetical protein